MRTDNFQFVEIADDLAQIIDGGASCMDIKGAIERWKTKHPNGSYQRYWKVTMNPGSPIEVSPMADAKQAAQMDGNGGQMSAMAVGNETTIDMNAYADIQGYIRRSSNSYSAS